MKTPHLTPISLRLAAVAGVLSLTVIASGARAEVPMGWVRLDNKPNGGTIDHTGTSNNIKVRVSFCGAWKTIGNRPLSAVSEFHDFSWNGLDYDPFQADRIEVTIDGDNWFWLDQLQLFENPFPFSHPEWTQKLREIGRDDMVGECFSTQASDGNAQVCGGSPSTPSILFVLPWPSTC